MPKLLTKNVRSCNSSIIVLSKELPTADLPIGVRKGGFQGSNPPPLKNGVQPYIHGNK